MHQLVDKKTLFFIAFFLVFFSVCEDSLGLSILVSMIRNHGNDCFQSYSDLKHNKSKNIEITESVIITIKNNQREIIKANPINNKDIHSNKKVITTHLPFNVLIFTHTHTHTHTHTQTHTHTHIWLCTFFFKIVHGLKMV